MRTGGNILDYWQDQYSSERHQGKRADMIQCKILAVCQTWLRPRAVDKSLRLGSSPGFTLLEVLVSLILGTLIVGGVMGVLSVSLQFMQRVDAKTAVQPVLEAAAQELLMFPERAKEGSLTLSQFPDRPRVDVTLFIVKDQDGYEINSSAGQLYQVQLSYRKNLLEFSLIIPPLDEL